MRNQPLLAIVFACVTALVGACQKPATAPASVVADTLYTNADVVTLADPIPRADSVAVKDGRILAVGNRADLEKAYVAGTTRIVDLQGKTLLPGFIDPHSHYINSISVANQVNVFAPPAGPGKDVAAIIDTLQRYTSAHPLAKGELLQAYGYDENAMPAGEALTRDALDRAFPDNPVLVGHVSMHGAVLNLAAFRRFGISAATKTPPGGVILRRKGSNEPAGLIMETAFLPVFSSLPHPSPEQEVSFSRAGQLLYAAAGITTAQEGATHATDLALMQRAAAGGATIIDIVAYPFVTDFDKIVEQNPISGWGKYVNRLKIGGAKITLDGSPQGRTAWFTTPYLTGGPGGEKNWRGEPGFPVAEARAFIKKVYDLGVPLNVHANGDAAIDELLEAHEAAAAGDLTRDRHVTVIHSQFVRPDQLDKFVLYRFTPSFFTLHTFYFGDTHVAQRGKEQAFFLSPMRAAIDKGLRPTNHTDFVVAPLDQMYVVWSAVNRVSRSGVVIGPEQRVTPLEALQAITINTAYQYGEQATKGSLERGKLADLVVLDHNPLKVDPLTIKDIRVLQTIKEGKTIYTAP